jgi:hypothetical protein
VILQRRKEQLQQQSGSHHTHHSHSTTTNPEDLDFNGNPIHHEVPGFVDEEQSHEIMNKIRDLLFYCFEHPSSGQHEVATTSSMGSGQGSRLQQQQQHNIGKKRLQLCLSDTAALSRSKWIFHRCLVAFENFDDYLANHQLYLSSSSSSSGSGSSGGNGSVLSAVGQLSHLSRQQGKTKVLESFLVLRPSELLFFLQLFDLSNISSLLATSSSTRRQLSDAISTLNSTELVNKLTKYSTSSSSSSSSSGVSSSSSSSSGLRNGSGRIYQSLSLDREVTYIINTDASLTHHGPGSKDALWLDLLQYDGMEGSSSSSNGGVVGVFNATPFSSSTTRDNNALLVDASDSLFLSPSSTNGNGNGSNTSANGGVALSSTNHGGMGSSNTNGVHIDDEDNPHVNELSSIQWLIQASRSILKRVYEDTSLFLKGSAITRELQELQTHLLSKQVQMKHCFQDWKKLQQSKEMLMNYKAQLSVLHDLMKNRHLMNANMNSNIQSKMKHLAGGGGGNGVSSSSSIETYRYPLLMNGLRMPMAMLQGENMPKPLIWIPSDEEKEMALLRIIHLQIVLEKQLQVGVQNAANTTRMLYTPMSTSVSNMTPKKGGFSATFGTPLRISSLRLSDDSDGVGGGGGGGSLPTLSPSTGGMNPLWAIMQNVFSNSMSTASNVSTAEPHHHTSSRSGHHHHHR